ncbi:MULTISPECIES: hypothetical protein [Kocuria]|uniref:Cell division protein FtsL n=1 Tax=Kocuria subflava TaxID=1736139 RepID=A0A846U593_9MICC|nr:MULTISPECIES: hypothetical protein [Kocuria]NKE08876.1 hypothetical protein [Kocuria subflava]
MTGSGENPRGGKGRLRGRIKMPQRLALTTRRQPSGSSVSAGTAQAAGSGAPPAVRRRWSALLPLAVAVLAVMATLAGILFLNIKISDGQYRLVEMRAQERALAQESEALTQDLEFYQAPQNVAMAATNEGMVSTTSEGLIDLDAQEVSGNPQPAPAAEDAEILVAQPVQRGSAAADRAASLARERRDALPESESQAQDQLQAANEAELGVNLHGGSLPAPQQRQPADATPSPSPTAAPTGTPADADAAGAGADAAVEQDGPDPAAGGADSATAQQGNGGGQ